MRLRVGLTGGIGAGKTEVAKIFGSLGALVIDADALAREAVAPGSVGLAEIARHFPQVVTAEGRLDRPGLAAIVFRDAGARAVLDGIVHPYVRLRGVEREAEAAPDQIVVHDVPLLFEAGFYRACDANVVVVADDETRTRRIVARSGLDPQEIRRRMRAQIDPFRARELADYTILNEASLASLQSETREVYDDLLTRRPRALARAPRNPSAP